MKQYFEVVFFDRQNSQKQPLTLEIDSDKIYLQEKNLHFFLDECSLSLKLEGVSQILTFKDGSYCVLKSEDTLVLKKSVVPFLESKIFYAFIIFFAIAGIAYFFLTIGGFWSAKFIAEIVPQHTLDAASKQTLEFFQKEHLRPTKLSLDRQKYLRDSFQKIAPKELSLKLHFYNSPLFKANAFALPSGDIVLLDDLVALDKDEKLRGIIGVLAHEIGHVKAKHSLRNIIQSSIAGIVVGYFIGDFSIIVSTLSTGAFTLSYSREFELEADKEGILLLKKHHISPLPLIKLFKRLQKKGDINGASIIFSTHPMFKNRIKKMKEYSK